jgi:hypothetical protein
VSCVLCWSAEMRSHGMGHRSTEGCCPPGWRASQLSEACWGPVGQQHLSSSTAQVLGGPNRLACSTLGCRPYAGPNPRVFGCSHRFPWACANVSNRVCAQSFVHCAQQGHGGVAALCCHCCRAHTHVMCVCVSGFVWRMSRAAFVAWTIACAGVCICPAPAPTL